MGCDMWNYSGESGNREMPWAPLTPNSQVAGGQGPERQDVCPATVLSPHSFGTVYPLSLANKMSTLDKQQCLASVETYCPLLQLLYNHISWCAQSTDPILMLSPTCYCTLLHLFTKPLHCLWLGEQMQQIFFATNLNQPARQSSSTIVFLNLLQKTLLLIFLCHWDPLFH